MKRILVATDFSALATAALRYAGNLAAQTGAELIALYADRFEPPMEFTSREIDDVASAINLSRRRAEEELERCVGQNVPATVHTRVEIVEDNPVPAIIGYAARNGVDLIVVGTHGRGGLQRLLLGSVSERVVAEATVPVIVVPRAAAAA
ncbi:MAG TPA: universal stress protein [Thermoanaerobaculia bacterium]|nr:universal stress protein [Thermoanaerobaculia bacterium]